MSRYDTCPTCGKQKRSISQYCNKCRFIESRHSAADPIEDPSPEWMREFCGLFWGEGSALIVPNNNSFTATLSLGLRADNLDVLENIQHYLGGSIVKSNSAMKVNPNASPAYQWKITGLDRVLKIAKLLIEFSQFPAVKRIEVQQVIEFCEWRLPKLGSPLSDEERSRMSEMSRINRETRSFSL